LRFFSHRLQHSVGVDAFAPAIEASRRQNTHNEYFLLDVLEIDDKFGENSFDCVLACDLIEHLPKEDGERLIAMMEKIATKKLFFTPPTALYLSRNTMVTRGSSTCRVGACAK
jgi:hypothetical protein